MGFGFDVFVVYRDDVVMKWLFGIFSVGMYCNNGCIGWGCCFYWCVVMFFWEGNYNVFWKKRNKFVNV